MKASDTVHVQVTWTRNAKLGRFTNFVNLLDMCAVSVPSAVYQHPQLGAGLFGDLRLSGKTGFCYSGAASQL